MSPIWLKVIGSYPKGNFHQRLGITDYIWCHSEVIPICPTKLHWCRDLENMSSTEIFISELIHKQLIFIHPAWYCCHSSAQHPLWLIHQCGAATYSDYRSTAEHAIPYPKVPTSRLTCVNVRVCVTVTGLVRRRCSMQVMRCPHRVHVWWLGMVMWVLSCIRRVSLVIVGWIHLLRCTIWSALCVRWERKRETLE